MNAVSLWLVSFFSLIFLTTCTHRWIASPDPVEPYKSCNPISTNSIQMVFVPDYKDTTVVVEYCDRFRRERVSIALRYFENEWNKVFGKSLAVHNNMRNLMITFGSEKRKINGYSEDGVLMTNADLMGITITKSSVWIYAPPWVERICDTSLIHELVHTSIWSINNKHGDPDHTGEKYPGWSYLHSKLIQDVNAELCQLGI